MGEKVTGGEYRISIREVIRLIFGLGGIVFLVYTIWFYNNLIKVLSALILFSCILLFNHALEEGKSILSVEKSRIRRIIAITFIFGYIIILFYGATGELKLEPEVLDSFVKFLGIVLAFYFGSEAVIVWKRGS